MSIRSFCINVFIFFNLYIFINCEKEIYHSFDPIINPNVIIKNCTIGEICSGSINSTTIHYYSIQYVFHPKTAIRLTTSMHYNETQTAPILVVVRQVLGVISWTLPYELSNGMIYSNASRILCAYNELNRTRPHLTSVFIEISTSNLDLIDYSIQLDNTTEYLIDKDIQQTFSVSPSMPVYYQFTSPSNSEDIFIEVQSDDDICTAVSVQSFDCPVYDVGEIGFRQGHYQTMSKRASFNVYSSEFEKRTNFLLVFVVKPTDVDCLDTKESAAIQPSGIIDIQRIKNATVILTSPNYSTFLYLTIFLTMLLFIIIYIVTLILMCKCSDIYDVLSEDNQRIVTIPTLRELTEQHNTALSNQTPEGEENVVSAIQDDYEQQVSSIGVIRTLPDGCVCVHQLALKDYETLKQKFRIYPKTMITIAIFYSLPVIQLVLQYQTNIDSIGNEDICYFNFLCTRQLAQLTAFNNVFSNIGYCVLGILFFIIVYRRDKAYAGFVQKYEAMSKENGIPQHFGLFYAMAISLFMEGIMSACYHVCPSKQNFQFDTSFMFIMAVLNIIKMYQIRHPDLNPHSAGVFSFLAAVIFVTVIGVYFDKQWFWISYAVAHIITCLILTGKLYYMGKLKFSFHMHRVLSQLIREQKFFSRPRYLNRMIILIITNIVNFSFALYGAITQPESFPNHLLFVFLGNLAIYLIYYIIMKLIHRERFTRISVLCLVLSLGFWAASLYFFYDEVKSYEVQPALSRTYNQRCILLKTYDAHDIWHLLSSFGLFLSFMSILTIDDGVRDKPRQNLVAF